MTFAYRNNIYHVLCKFKCTKCHVQVWFYAHTTRFSKQDKNQFSYLANWDRFHHGGRYDANVLLKDIREDEVIVNVCYLLV